MKTELSIGGPPRSSAWARALAAVALLALACGCRPARETPTPPAPAPAATAGTSAEGANRGGLPSSRPKEPTRPHYPNLAGTSRDAPFVNSLGMKLVPVPGTKVLFCIWETRVKDYAVFLEEVPRSRFKSRFEQGPDHPVVYVSWDDAQVFCEWLTKKERNEGLLRERDKYRLPSDLEWSWAVAIGAKERICHPKEKNGELKGVFPWGEQWPPPTNAGNYAQKVGVDNFQFTSPVGSFAANEFGLFDLGGNVWEWCEDWYCGEDDTRVLRGASWANSEPLASSARGRGRPDQQADFAGIRVVLAVEAAP
jgi:hypothetical protein